MSSSQPVVTLNEPSATALRVIIPIVYILIAIAGLIGNLIILQIICANRFRHKSIHILVCCLIVEDIFFIIIFTVVRALSYGYLSTKWFINPDTWCKAEMYLLRVFDFVLAYTIVFMCIDRAVQMRSCWYSIRKFRSGLSIVVCIWLTSAYLLIPVLLFKQNMSVQGYGGYLCLSTDQSVPLFWLGNTPRITLDFIDIVFRIYFPIFLMILIIAIASINKLSRMYQKNSMKSNSSLLTDPNNTLSSSVDRANKPTSSYSGFKGSSRNLLDSNLIYDDVTTSSSRFFIMVIAYAIVFALCELPYEIYRSVMLFNSDLEANLRNQNIDYAVEIPLLILKLINRCINPFLFICIADAKEYRKKFCRLWCCPCLPGCIGCKQCWCIDCWRSTKYELNHCLGKSQKYSDDWVPTGLQTISTQQYRDGDKTITKQRIIEEYETGVEPYYKNPKLRDRLDDNGGLINETFDNYESYRTPNITQSNIDEHKRIKL